MHKWRYFITFYPADVTKWTDRRRDLLVAKEDLKTNLMKPNWIDSVRSFEEWLDFLEKTEEV